MIPLRIDGATHVLKAPGDWDKEKDGTCSSLAVRVEGGVFWSAWEPTPAERDIIASGGSVVLGVWGGQPPVALTVQESPSDDEVAP